VKPKPIQVGYVLYKLLVLLSPTNVRIRTNTLAYLACSSVTKKKVFKDCFLGFGGHNVKDSIFVRQRDEQDDDENLKNRNIKVYGDIG
jgi:hypothetical protein